MGADEARSLFREVLSSEDGQIKAITFNNRAEKESTRVSLSDVVKKAMLDIHIVNEVCRMEFHSDTINNKPAMVGRKLIAPMYTEIISIDPKTNTSTIKRVLVKTIGMEIALRRLEVLLNELIESEEPYPIGGEETIITLENKRAILIAAEKDFEDPAYYKPTKVDDPDIPDLSTHSEVNK